MNYKLDWIDANTNAYGPAFIQLAGKSLSFQRNFADLPAVYPLEKASANPASQQVINMYAKYAPGQPITLQALQAFSAWLIFAVSAESCGSADPRERLRGSLRRPPDGRRQDRPRLPVPPDSPPSGSTSIRPSRPGGSPPRSVPSLPERAVPRCTSTGAPTPRRSPGPASARA